MMGYWICFAFLTAVLVTPTMEAYGISREIDRDIDELLHSLLHEEEEEEEEEEGTYMNKEEWFYTDKGNGNCGVCGSPDKTNRLIVNGEIVTLTHNYPWMVSLYVNGIKNCGAFIISENFIMTASHCIRRRNIKSKLDENTCVFHSGKNGTCYHDANEVKIRFLTKTSELTPGRKVAEIIAHPQYQPGKLTVEHDIALIRMSEAIQCGKYAAPICLPSPTMQPEIGMVMGIAGWGATMNPKEADGKMRMTHIQVVDPSYKCTPIPGFNTKSSICLSGKGKSSPCSGDSGGPAYIQKENKFYAMGVACAHSSSQCQTSEPVIYTSISNYMTWIKQVTGIKF